MRKSLCVLAAAATILGIWPCWAVDLPAIRADRENANRIDGATDSDLDRTKDRLTAEIKEILKSTGIPSISIALFRDDRIVWSDAFGYSNVKLRVPASPSTIYSTGSCFKSVTALAVMQLADQGKLKLDDPVNNYLGDSPIQDMSDAGTPVTIRHLLSHYSGLKAKRETDAMNSEIVPLWERRLPKSLTDLPAEIVAEDAPGTKHRYSNYGYALAGLLVQRVSGQSYEQYIVDNILKPAGVELVGPVNPTPEMVEELALPYRLEGGKSVPEVRYRFDVYPAGDAYLSVPAMATVLLLHLNGGSHDGVALLSESSVKEMHEPQFGGTYGLGFGIRELDGEKLLTHAGGVPGYSTNFFLATNSKVGVYVAANGGGAHLPTRYLSQLAIDLLLGKQLGTGLVREIVGIGTALAADEKTGLLRITDILPNSPASQAGLTAGLMIQKVDGISVEGKSMEECLAIIAGAAGTTVRLELCNPDRMAAKTIELTRQKFLTPS